MAEEKEKISKTPSLFAEVTNDRKYASLVDEFRRIYQKGMTIEFKHEDKNVIYSKALEFFMENLKSTVDLENIFTNSKFKIGKVEAEVIEFIKNDNITIRYYDHDGTEARITLALRKPTFFGKNKIYIDYVEWYKSQRSFFGLADQTKKRMIDSRVKYRAALLTKFVTQKMSLPDQNWAKTAIYKAQKKGYLSA